MSKALAEALREAAEAAEDIGTERGPGEHIVLSYLTPTRLQRAIEIAFDRVKIRRKSWRSAPGIAYPKWRGSSTAWPSSEAAIGPAIHLPAGEIKITDPIYLPQCVSLVGPSFGSCNFKFVGQGCLRVLGNLQPSEGEPFQQLRGQISGVKFVAGDVEPVQMWGDLANWRFTNNHIIRVGAKFAGIQHVNAFEEETPFGKILTRDGGGHTLKEVVIRDNQFEGFSVSVSISGATRCKIHDNFFEYANLGIEARNCNGLMVTANGFYGAKKGDDIQPGDQAGIIGSGKTPAIHSNVFADLDAAVLWRGAKLPRLMNSNTLEAVPRGRGEKGSLITGRWRSPKNFGPFQKGAKPPYAID